MFQFFIQIDTSLFFLLNNLAGHSSVTDFVIVFFAKYLAYILIVVFLFLVYRSINNLRDKLIMLSIVGLSSLVARFGITELIRFFYHRPRPFITYHVQQLLTETSYSFPSGHSTCFFAFSYAIYLYNKKWGRLFFCATILMTISRVIAGVHYPSDIIAGAIIGVIVAQLSFFNLRVWVRNIINKIIPTSL